MITKKKILPQLGICLFAASYNATMQAADIYRSESEDGIVRFASQPLDASYTLFSHAGKSESVPQVQGRRPSRKAVRNAALEKLIQQLADKHQMDALLVRAIIEVESNFNPAAVSRKGAKGLMQLMPSTARRYGAVDMADPVENIEAGIRHIKHLLSLYNGNLTLALASYNAGEGAIAKHGLRIPPYRETMLYVPAVLASMENARVSTAP